MESVQYWIRGRPLDPEVGAWQIFWGPNIYFRKVPVPLSESNGRPLINKIIQVLDEIDIWVMSLDDYKTYLEEQAKLQAEDSTDVEE